MTARKQIKKLHRLVARERALLTRAFPDVEAPAGIRRGAAGHYYCAVAVLASGPGAPSYVAHP
jgi:hypothetical protein